LIEEKREVWHIAKLLPLLYNTTIKYFTKEEADPQAEGVFIRTSDFMLKDKDQAVGH